MKSQVKLRFDSKEEAIAYATRNGIAYRVEEPKLPQRKILSYSDNFQAQSRRALVALTRGLIEGRLRSSAG